MRWVDTGSSILPSGKAPWSANRERNWAPEIHRVGSRFVAYFTAVNANDALAIGVASADTPRGPWTVESTPLVDDPTPGVIDATAFEDDDGRLRAQGGDVFVYHAWTNDGSGRPAPGGRRVLVDAITWKDGWPEIAGPTP